MTNPLLNLPLHPDYPSIKAEHIEEAVTTRLEHAKDQLKALALKDVSLGWRQSFHHLMNRLMHCRGAGRSLVI